MTKDEAVTRIRKLKKVASSSSATAGEISNAKNAAEELRRKFDLSEDLIDRGVRAEAFDDLVGRIEATSKLRAELPGAVTEVLGMLKKEMSEEEKARGLEKIVGAVRVASLLFGRSKWKAIRDAVEETLKKHDVTF